MSTFQNREAAGRRLGEQLLRYQDEAPVVLALPRGGVPVGAEISRALDAPLDVIIARKLGAPGQPELAIGAVAPGGVRLVNERVVRWLGIPEDWIELATEEGLAEAERRMRRFREGRPALALRERSVILVDDGIATGMTARAAILAIRAEEPRQIILAVPVCAKETAEKLSREVDELVCLEIPDDLWAIGLWYRDFHQVPDEEVVDLLEEAHEN
ncbi:phosphoribosyltransferase [soil metagenome]|jgi:predicted phosphoribosyltransferase